MTRETIARAAALTQSIHQSGPSAGLCAELGELLERERQYPGAAACYRQALETDPENPALAFRLGNLLTRLGLLDEAAARYTDVVRIEPRFAEGWFNLGVVRSMRSEISAALDCYHRAVDADPRHAAAHNNLAILYHVGGRKTEARSEYRRALSAAPDYGQARYNLALLDQQEDRLEAALRGYRRVLANQPDHSSAHNNLGNVLLALNRVRDARRSYLAAIQHHPGYVEAHWNLGFADLLLGRWAEGWRGYEWRLKQPEAVVRHAGIPRWTGEPLAGRRLLLWAEQGLGDTIQVIRFARWLRDLGAEVAVEAQRPLLPLLAAMPDAPRLYEMGAPMPLFDFALPMMSLPFALEVRLRDLPGPMPYLAAPPGRAEHWRRRLSEAGNPRPRVGLAWAGNPKHKNDARRSIPPEVLAPLTSLPLRFIALQPDSIPVPGVERFGAELTDFGETAGLVENLDLVISVDTAVAHLAGAMARPVWTLLPFAPDFRWMLDRADSPWYPSMRLFRQQSRGGWKETVERVRGELTDLLIRAR